MQLIWERGPSTAEDVRTGLSRPLKESTIRTVLTKLEEKGYVTHRVDKRTYVYQAAKRPNQVAAGAVKRIIDRLCNGSIEDVLVGMVDAEILDPKQLQDLATKIAKARKDKT